MGKKDTITKDYMKNNAVFADVFNHLMYEGKNVIQPEQLRPFDTTTVVVSEDTDNFSHPIQKIRDQLKGVSLMEDGEKVYLLLGIENQSELHYAMPVRNMLYDAMEYITQVEERSKINDNKRRQGLKEKISSGEFLTGFYKRDRLIPVVTLVVYFGADAWDAPRNLHEMFDVRNKEILKYIPDYKINLIIPAEMTDEEINQFQTNFREVMLFIKYSKDKVHFKKLISEDVHFRNIDLKTARVISAITGSEIKLEYAEEEINMCQAIDEMVEDGREEGRKEERAAGISALIEIAQEYLIPKEKLMKKLEEKFNLSAKEAEDYISLYMKS